MLPVGTWNGSRAKACSSTPPQISSTNPSVGRTRMPISPREQKGRAVYRQTTKSARAEIGQDGKRRGRRERRERRERRMWANLFSALSAFSAFPNSSLGGHGAGCAKARPRRAREQRRELVVEHFFQLA